MKKIRTKFEKLADLWTIFDFSQLKLKKNSSHKNGRHSAKFQYFELQFFANILILIVLTDSTIKTLCYMRSCGVNFENSEIFRFLRGPKGGFPPKISNYFFAKNQVTPLYEKSNNKITCFQCKKHRNQRYRFGG